MAEPADKALVAKILNFGQERAIALCEFDAQQIAELVVFAELSLQVAVETYYESHRQELDQRMAIRIQYSHPALTSAPTSPSSNTLT